jgi:hypothetical protein
VSVALAALDAAAPRTAGPGLRERIELVVGSDEVVRRRLPKARTTVAIVVVDAPDESVTLLLDRRPPEVCGAFDAEVTVLLNSEQASEFAEGRLLLSTALLHGEAKWTGPVRKYLAVDAVLRGALRRAAAEADA